jgi:trehalose 6-phosphate phosphatase
MTNFHGPLRFAVEARRRGRPLVLFLDYDGTLVEIAPRPELARPSPELLELLGRLTAQRDLKVMVVSGRPLRDLQELLPVPGLDFLGSHGGEAFISGRLHFRQTTTADRQELLHWRTRLEAWMHPFPGWWIEDKPLGFAIHYRQVPPEHADEFLGMLGRWQEKLRREGRFQILEGKRVLELLPQGVSKGLAIREILTLLPEMANFFPVYVGDDVTDESAFQILQGQGLTIKVGRPGAATAATHFLPDPGAVQHFLTLLAFPPEDL